VQLVVCFGTLQLLSVICRKGSVHDEGILKESRSSIHPGVEKLADAGYQGIHKLYDNSHTPIKRSAAKPRDDEAKQLNRDLARKRIFIEHVNRRCKIFRITKETYRGKHRTYGKTWNVVAALVNLRYSSSHRHPVDDSLNCPKSKKLIEAGSSFLKVKT
jgi:hypothetical protein